MIIHLLSDATSQILPW